MAGSFVRPGPPHVILPTELIVPESSGCGKDRGALVQSGWVGARWGWRAGGDQCSSWVKLWIAAITGRSSFPISLRA